MEKSTYINLFMSVSSEDIMPEGSIAKIVIDEHKALSDEIERLREALFVIEGWYPTDVSNPHNQIKKMKEVAHLALNGDFQKYVADHYAALEEGE